MELSCEKAQCAVQLSSYTGIKNHIKEDVINTNKNKNEQMNQFIKQVNHNSASIRIMIAGDFHQIQITFID